MLHIEGIVDPNGVCCVESLIRDNVLRSCIYIHSTTSTNTLAFEELHGNKFTDQHLPRLYLTDAQTAGRGRLGRTWFTSDDSLTFSTLIRNTNVDAPTSVPLSLAAGVAIAEAIDALLSPVATQIKWPNDVYVHGKKVAGILVEVNQKHPTLAVVGIGINIHTAPSLEQNQAAAVEAASLSQFVSHSLSRFDVLDEVMRRLVETMSEPVTHRFRQKCCLTGELISLHHGGQDRQGECRGIDDCGRLVIEIDGKLVAIQSGEATRVRRR